METKWKKDEWSGCYPSNWKGMIVPEAMAHPAKFSSRLIRRIYEHLQEEGWVKAGDTIVDPFGGVSLGALNAMRLGLRWRGVELEAKFVELGNWNIDNWNAKFHSMPKWSKDAVLLQGDSRKLMEILSGGRAADSSPPYAETELTYKKNGLKVEGREKYERPYMAGQGEDNYGSTDGQLGAMKGDGFEAAISSPPFEQKSADGGWQMLGKYSEQGKLTVKQVKGDAHKSYPSWNKDRDTSYGQTDGQLSQMDSGNFAAAMRSSPPFGNNDSAHAQSLEDRRDKSANWLKENTGWKTGYGDSDGQLADMDMQDGFQAAISSPPFRQSEGGTGAQGGMIDPALMQRHSAGNGKAEGYGGSDGQLANMEEGSFDAVISSPPFADSLARDGVDADARRQLAREQGISNAEHITPIDMERIGERKQEYGVTEGNLGGMKSENFAVATRSSPPYAEMEITGQRNFKSRFQPDAKEASAIREEDKGYGEKFGAAMKSPPYEGTRLAETGNPMDSMRRSKEEKYSATYEEKMDGNDFWQAARQIVEQVFLALEPGGHAVWVCKDFVKAKQIVPFSDQWRQLCEAVGFVTLHEHHAMLGHKVGQQTIEGEVVHKKHISFFRRLAEKKGSPKIEFETVWCMVKPASPSPSPLPLGEGNQT
jgi:DNA modification methylase